MDNTFEEHKPIDKKKPNIKPNRPRKPVEKSIQQKDINYENFIKNKIQLTTYKLPELKAALKKHNLKISGKKEILVERLEGHFNHTFLAQRIQKVFRGWLIRNLIKLKGPALRNISICVNDKDFVTMEPLNEIKKEMKKK